MMDLNRTILGVPLRPRLGVVPVPSVEEMPPVGAEEAGEAGEAAKDARDDYSSE